jgi:hypothetical protein
MALIGANEAQLETAFPQSREEITIEVCGGPIRARMTYTTPGTGVLARGVLW